MEQAKKKAEAVVNTVDISEREKMAQLKRYDCNVLCSATAFELFCDNSVILNILFFFSFLNLSVFIRKPAWGRRREK